MTFPDKSRDWVIEFPDKSRDWAVEFAEVLLVEFAEVGFVSEASCLGLSISA